MHGKPVERHQADELQQTYNDLTATINAEESLTRQEFKEDADVNAILKRFGVSAFAPPDPRAFGDIDFTEDLQSSLDAIDAVAAAWGAIAPDVRSKYPTWAAVLKGLQSKELTVTDGAIALTPKPIDAPPPTQ